MSRISQYIYKTCNDGHPATAAAYLLNMPDRTKLDVKDLIRVITDAFFHIGDSDGACQFLKDINNQGVVESWTTVVNFVESLAHQDSTIAALAHGADRISMFLDPCAVSTKIRRSIYHAMARHCTTNTDYAMNIMAMCAGTDPRRTRIMMGHIIHTSRMETESDAIRLLDMAAYGHRMWHYSLPQTDFLALIDLISIERHALIRDIIGNAEDAFGTTIWWKYYARIMQFYASNMAISTIVDIINKDRLFRFQGTIRWLEIFVKAQLHCVQGPRFDIVGYIIDQLPDAPWRAELFHTIIRLSPTLDVINGYFARMKRANITPTIFMWNCKMRIAFNSSGSEAREAVSNEMAAAHVAPDEYTHAVMRYKTPHTYSTGATHGTTMNCY